MQLCVFVRNSLIVAADSHSTLAEFELAVLPPGIVQLTKSILFINSHKVSLRGCYVYVCLWLPHSVPVNVLGVGLRMVRMCLSPAFGAGGPSYFNRCYRRVDRPLALG